MKYSEMKYTRPDITKCRKKLLDLIDQFRNAKTLYEADKLIISINDIRNEFDSMRVMAFIKYCLDTNNKNFIAEQDYFDNNTPVFSDFILEYYKALVDSSHKEKLTEKYGSHLFEIAKINLKSFSPDIIEDLQKENLLYSEYMKLKASAVIPFDNKGLNLSGLNSYMESTDRNVRHSAYKAYWKFFSDNSKEFDEIYDRSVSLRNDMALKMGYETYTELGYARMNRVDYNEEMVSEFRKNVKKYIVPLSVKLRDKQKKRNGLDKLMIYDLTIQFKSGNAKPKGDPVNLAEKAKQMYKELSPETGEFYDFMVDNELMNLFSKKGKADLCYCDYIPKYNSPYIFANLNGTERDIIILTHEAGHAFQSYASRNFQFREFIDPTNETAEIHSMSMEFFAYPWLNLFFENDTDKFKFSHLNNAVNFIPYGALADEFQHWVYENPDAEPIERKAKWRELEKIYMPYLNHGDIDFLEAGGRWQNQDLIYERPFFYIDYCLAQVCAFQFWSRAIHNKGKVEFENSWKDYTELCSKGGSKPFLELVKETGLDSPFEKAVIQKLAFEIETYIDSIDDSVF